MKQILVHVLNNDGSLLLDEKGNPIPKVFTEVHWENIKKMSEFPKFKKIKYFDETIKGKVVDVDAEIIEPEQFETEITNELQEKGASVKIFTENLEDFTIDELKLFLNDSRKSIVKLAKEQIEKLS